MLNRKRKSPSEGTNAQVEHSSVCKNPRRSQRQSVKAIDNNYIYPRKVTTRKLGHLGLFAIRTDHRKIITNAQGVESPRRSSAIIDPTKMLGMDTPAKKCILKEVEKLNDRPVGEIILDEKGSPIAVKSIKTKRIISRVHTLGPIHIYTNDQPFEEKPHVKTLDKSSVCFQKFTQSAQYAAIQEFHENFKEQELFIHAEQQNNVVEEKKAAGNRRVQSQHKTIAKPLKGAEKKASATSYALASGEFPEMHASELNFQQMKWEWLHLIAYSIIGKKGQIAENLVAGTAHANTVMMFPEATIQKLSKAYPEGFTLKVKAAVIPGTHIATTFEYTIITKNFTIPFIINAQERKMPLSIFKNYLDAVINGLIARYIKMDTSDNKENIPPVKNSKVMRTLFFSSTSSSLEGINKPSSTLLAKIR